MPACNHADTMTHPNVVRVLDVSTGHLTKTAALTLRSQLSVGAFGYQGHDDHCFHTYVIDIQEAPHLADAMGQGLKDVLEIALSLGIGYVRFDQDAAPLTGAHLNAW